MNRGSGERLTDGRLGAADGDGGVCKTRTFWMEEVANMVTTSQNQQYSTAGLCWL